MPATFLEILRANFFCTPTVFWYCVGGQSMRQTRLEPRIRGGEAGKITRAANKIIFPIFFIFLGKTTICIEETGTYFQGCIFCTFASDSKNYLILLLAPLCKNIFIIFALIAFFVASFHFFDFFFCEPFLLANWNFLLWSIIAFLCSRLCALHSFAPMVEKSLAHAERQLCWI